MPLSGSMPGRLLHQHKIIKDLTAGLTEQQVKHRVRPDKWSAFENIVHLAAYQPTHIYRIQRIMEDNNPSFDRYVAEKDPLFDSYLQKSLEELNDDLAVNRLIILNKLQEAGDEGLKRRGQHPKYGILTLTQWTEFFLLHEAHHLFTVFMLTQEVRGL